MQIRIRRENTEKIKKILRKYNKKDIVFNEPHFSLKLERNNIDRKEVIMNLLKPENLVFVGVSKSKNPQTKFVYDLYFKLSKRRIFKISISIRPKYLYLITIFKIRRSVQDEIFKYYCK